MNIAVIGASGRLGRKVVARLAARGETVIAVGRTAARLPVAERGIRHALADCDDPTALADALVGADAVVSCVHARFAPAVLAALPATARHVVLLGSTRRFTRFPDIAAAQVTAAEDALAASGRAGVILHPTMIYGADGENNVQRIAALIRRFGVLPLPQGGRCLIQPIHVDDVAACVEAAVERGTSGPAIIAAGPEAISLADFARAIARADGRRVSILPAPAWAMFAAAALLRLVPGSPKVTAAEVRRLMEDKNFPIDAMTSRLGVVPRSLADGLAATFAPRGA